MQNNKMMGNILGVRLIKIKRSCKLAIFWAGLIMLVIVTCKYHRGAMFGNESKP